MLRPLDESDLGWVFDLYVGEATGFRWHLEGGVPSFEEFVTSPGFVLEYPLSVAVVNLRTDSPIGVGLVGPVDEISNTCQVGMCVAPRFIGSGRGAIAALMLLHMLFERFNMRKVYTYSAEFSFQPFLTGFLRYATVEARLRRHHYFDDRYWDVYVLAMLREQWERHKKASLAQLFADVAYVEPN